MKIENLKEKFPKIYEDLKTSPTIGIDEIKNPNETSCPANKNTEKQHSPIKEETKIPSIKDHLKGCETPQQAKEIIEYFKKQKEITKTQAKKLKKQLKTEGLRSFGEKREKGEIEKKGL
ncbi:DUF2095 family protein [Methanonatronarchaeum sp. AMET-Sl]|uniref:DUF2095 family protein n=1 Tax=Methanonatronarchaeum sp. AMET-Sl TaxID=3037654 RepID=UPI00244E1E2A|nr:DUF2095 family protein [Methanonatronarchaeum sp. AMET-Sl]WGI16975.1 DUF2095 family protein [Methanonatronarchaeum sp. AMET-Sl]